MIVVSDASPIIALAVCGKLGLLDVLFEKICIPLDEKRGRTIAARNGIKTIGTIDVLLLAKQKGHIAALKPSLDMLMNTGFRISNTLYQDIVGRSGES